MKLEVHQLLKEEVYRGWVRIPEAYRLDSKNEPIREASFVRITCGSKKVIAIVRGDAEAGGPWMRMDENYRNRLGVKLSEKLDFQLELAGSLDEFCFHWRHPEPTTRLAMRLAVLSVILGITSVFATVVLGIWPLVMR